MFKILAAFAAIGAAVLLWPRRGTDSETNASYFPMDNLTDNRPRGIRNNNPTNIVDAGIPWLGLAGNDGRFCVFRTPIYGLRAGFLNIYSAIHTHGADTIRTLIARWAPPIENLTGSYQNSVRQQTGIASVDTKLNYGRDAIPLIRAIVRHENGQDPYTSQQYDQAFREAGK